MCATQKLIAIQKVCLRRAKLMKRFNAGNLRKYLKMYAVDAILRDPDLHRITGINDFAEYFAMLFEFSRKRGFPPMQLKSKRMVLEGKFIYDFGTYRWSTLQCGSYVHKWTWIKDDFYLMSHSFTIEESLINDENMNIL